jgi:Sulfotransferase family
LSDDALSRILSPLEATITSVAVDGLPDGISIGISSPRSGSRGVLPFAFLLEGLLTADAEVDHIEVRLGQRKLREVAVKLVTEEEREESASPAPEGLRLYRFSALVGTVRAPRSFALGLRVVLASKAAFDVCVIAGTRAALSFPAGTSARLSPLMVTSLARTGTTWLMRLLSEHPELVMDARYPFEAKPQRYWAHWFQIMAEPANYRESTDLHTFTTQPWSVGPNPFFTAAVAKDDPALAQQLAGEHVVALAGFAHHSAETYYLSCMTRYGRPNARFSVEKHAPDIVPRLLWELYPDAKEIFLVRDPRDMLASILAFNDKRGSSRFGRDRVETDADFVRQLAANVSTLNRTWETRREQSHLVRYEDLLARPEDVLREAFEYVGIDSSAEMVKRVLGQASARSGELASHMTSRDQGASMGRWERDLPADVQALCSEEFGPALAEFGYAR